jgi:hypothetical protein
VSEWDDRVSQHPSTQGVRQLAELASVFPASTDPALVEAEERAKQVIQALMRLIDETDPALVTQGMLDRLSGPVSNALSALSAYGSAKDAQQLANANVFLDSALDNLAGWTTLRLQTRPTAVRDAAASYRRAAREFMDGLHKTVSALQGEADEVSARLVTVQEDASKSAQDAQRALDELRAVVEAQKARLDDAIATFQKQFADAEAARALQAQETATALSEEHRVLREKLNTDANEVLTAITEQRSRAEKLVDVIGAIGFSGGFGSYARQQQQSADIWRRASVASLIALIAVVAWYVWNHVGGVLTWEALAERLIFVVPLAALATYAGAQSGRHRAVERYARKVELELAALDPYLTLLPDAERIAIKTKLADRLFGQPWSEDTGEKDVAGPQQLLAVIEKLIGRIGR